jgi:hypothetical protein
VKFIKYKDNSWQLEEYLEYLNKVRDELPSGAREFALSPEHYDFENPKCPHDSWVECISIKETSTGKRSEKRALEITAKFLGSFHDGFFEILYKDVQKYSLNLERAARENTKIGHGDWIIDEILFESSGLVSHEIVFSDSGMWKINCADILYRWIPKPH